MTFSWQNYMDQTIWYANTPCANYQMLYICYFEFSWFTKLKILTLLLDWQSSLSHAQDCPAEPPAARDEGTAAPALPGPPDRKVVRKQHRMPDLRTGLGKLGVGPSHVPAAGVCCEFCRERWKQKQTVWESVSTAVLQHNVHLRKQVAGRWPQFASPCLL